MAYCTQADILKVATTKVLSSLTDGSAGAVDAAILADAIEESDEQIDSFLGAVYAVPLSPTPKRIKRASIRLTLYNLATRPGKAGIDPLLMVRGEAELAYLKAVARGEQTIPGLAPANDWVRLAPASAVPVFSMRRQDTDGNAVGTPEMGTLDNY